MALRRGVTFQARFEDDGVGMAPVNLSAWRGSLPVRDGLTTTDHLPEASEYSLHGTYLQDRLGNRIDGSTEVLGGPFSTDYVAPTITADRPSGAPLAGPITHEDGTVTDDALVFLVADPLLADGAAGSGVSRLSIRPAGTVTAGVARVTLAQLRAAGATGQTTVIVTATDLAGNVTTVEQEVDLASSH
ncbi:hypothetical protein [Deinococcus multiflagellatus]|uniref:Uncharacterized protein n=2 Tax=Deinococcus multiflagellatus TaxID=1656887 RepID=A0ABW1ZS50_9DEIO